MKGTAVCSLEDFQISQYVVFILVNFLEMRHSLKDPSRAVRR